MNFYLFASIVLIIVYLKNFHYQNITPDTYMLEEYFSLKTLSKKIRVMGPGGPYFTIRHPKKIKFIKDLSCTTFFLTGVLKDKSSYTLSLKCNIIIPKNIYKLKFFFNNLSYDDYDVSNENIVKNNVKNFISDALWRLIKEKTYSDLATTAQLDDCMTELFDLLKDFDNSVFEFESISATFTVSGAYGSTIADVFESAELTFAGLQEAGYDEQQINQILKASEKNIYLNNINPLVPEEVFRKIRRIYGENNKVLKNYIYKLTLKNKTPEEIEKICDDILAL